MNKEQLEAKITKLENDLVTEKALHEDTFKMALSGQCGEAFSKIKELKETMVEEEYKADLILAETRVELFSLLSEASKLDKDNLELRKKVAINMCSIKALTTTIKIREDWIFNRDTTIDSLTRQIKDAGLQADFNY